MRIIANIAYDQGVRIDAGQGKNSVGVYLCTDEALAGEFAVKVIEKSKLPDPTAFWNEAKAMYAARHENVVPVQYGCQTQDHIMLAMPYCKRGSLATRIAAAPLRLHEVIRVAQHILSGVHQIHAAGHVHYDVKPTNVLFSENDIAMVADFGQAMAIAGQGIAPAPARIYVAGMPPEVLQTGNGLPASDVFQVGLTLYRAANGEPFFDNQFNACWADLRQMIIDGAFPDRDAWMPHVPRSLRMVINKALQTDIDKRYSTALEFANALGRVNPKNDWQTICDPAKNEFEWRSQRLPRADLVVRMLCSGSKRHVKIFHESLGKCKTTKKILWKEGLTERQSFPYLRQVFAALE